MKNPNARQRQGGFCDGDWRLVFPMVLASAVMVWFVCPSQATIDAAGQVDGAVTWVQAARPGQPLPDTLQGKSGALGPAQVIQTGGAVAVRYSTVTEAGCKGWAFYLNQTDGENGPIH